MKKANLLLTLFTYVVALSAWADEVHLNNGSVLMGEVTAVDAKGLTIKTDFAGELTLAYDQVKSFDANQQQVVRLQNGEMATGSFSKTDGSDLTLKTKTGVMPLAAADIQTSWKLGEKDPAVIAQEGKWTFEVAAGLTSDFGNSPQTDIKGAAKATRKTDDDRLDTSIRFKISEDELASGKTERTEEEIIADAKYTAFFREDLGWYVREELERDRFENLELRSTTAAGLTWKPIDNDVRSLELSGGLSNRYETYGFDLNDDGIEDRTGSESFPGMDFGLKHYWKIASWVEMNNKLTYSPAFKDLGDYRIDHLSSLDIPLSDSDLWNLRFSMENSYNSKVASSSTEKLDTTVAMSVLLKWK